MFLLENVKNLRSHNKGDTWKTIKGTLDQLDYSKISRLPPGILPFGGGEGWVDEQI